MVSSSQLREHLALKTLPQPESHQQEHEEWIGHCLKVCAVPGTSTAALDSGRLAVRRKRADQQGSGDDGRRNGQIFGREVSTAGRRSAAQVAEQPLVDRPAASCHQEGCSL